MSTSVYEQFAPILIFLIIAFGLGAAFAIIGKVLSVIVGANNPNKPKEKHLNVVFRLLVMQERNLMCVFI